MKRNWDLIRKILINLEEKDFDRKEICGLDNVDETEFYYHVKILAEAGLIDARNIKTSMRNHYYAVSLTWQGHEFLDKIRNETVWNNVKAKVKDKSLDLSFDVIKSLATKFITSMLG